MSLSCLVGFVHLGRGWIFSLLASLERSREALLWFR